MSVQLTAPLVDTDGEPPVELPPGSVLGRYVVLDVVGSGGAGTVYAVYDSALDRKVALKLLRAKVGDQWAAVVREARMLARVNHPAVVTVYDVGDLDGCPFVAMEFVAGGDLSVPAPERTAAEAIALWLDTARGLAAAHAAGIVHGDFKPANVLVDDAGRPRVSDFGIARATGHAGEPTLDPESPEPADATTNPSRRIAGTPLYMAPEQLRGRPPTERSDIYAQDCAWPAVATASASSAFAALTSASTRTGATETSSRSRPRRSALANRASRGTISRARLRSTSEQAVKAELELGHAGLGSLRDLPAKFSAQFRSSNDSPTPSRSTIVPVCNDPTHGEPGGVCPR